jgi:hypothetical protein
VVAFGRKYHVIVRSEFQAKFLPGLKVVPRRNCTTDPLLSANRPELLKSTSSLNGWLVDAGTSINVVRATVRLYRATLFSLTGRIVRAVRFDDIVFDQRVASPAIESKIAVFLWVESAGVTDCPVIWHISHFANSRRVKILPDAASLPTLTGNKVTGVIPVHAVSTAWPVSVRNGSTFIGPE